MDLQQHNSFLLQQKLTLLINRYQYFLYDGGVKGVQVAFAEQKRFAFREQVTVWTSESQSEKLFEIQAEMLLDIHGKFLVTDPHGSLIGYCRKAFGASLLRSTWEMYTPSDQRICVVKEKSPAIAIVRRIAGFIPYLTEIAPFFPFNFLFEKDGSVVGTHTRVWGTFTDQYALQIEPPLADCDRRLLLAMGILLDALQDR